MRRLIKWFLSIPLSPCSLTEEHNEWVEEKINEYYEQNLW